MPAQQSPNDDLLSLAPNWAGSAWHTESTFHQLSPYIGKTKSSMASSLITEFSDANDLVYDPFSGCGTIAFEAWSSGRHVVANDLSPYALLLTRAKLFPYRSLDHALFDIRRLSRRLSGARTSPRLDTVPVWVRQFFHSNTLRELLMWVAALRAGRLWFLLACLMGILHHQRPGFLSFPSSHTVPYLRTAKFPPEQYPRLYEYRSVRDRLEAKVRRAFMRVPTLNYDMRRHCYGTKAETLRLTRSVATIVTSPPYMRQLDYGRDNRLRLWFLGCRDHESLDTLVSPREQAFLTLMRRCFRHWRTMLKPGGYCILVVGDRCSRVGTTDLPNLVGDIATTQGGGYSLVKTHTETIPNARRVRRGITGSMSEAILVLRRTSQPAA